MRLALVGAGNIADRYAAAIVAADGLELAGATDPVPGRADAIAAAHGGVAYPSLDDLLADAAVDTVVNLTPPRLTTKSARRRSTRASMSTARSRSLSATRTHAPSSTGPSGTASG